MGEFSTTEDGNLQEKKEAVNLPRLKDLEVLAFFYINEIDKKMQGAKNDTTADAHRKSIDEMRNTYYMLGNFQHDGVNDSGDLLAKIEERIQTEESSVGQNNLLNLKEFVEAHKDRLPKNFTKAREDIEKLIEESEK